MRLPLKGLSKLSLQRLHAAAQRSLDGFQKATEASGSLIQSWTGGLPVQSLDHYPASDVMDHVRGGQFFYHCHRSHANEHGHVHLFAHATRSGRRRYMKPEDSWTRSAPSHLLAIGLDARGLPISLFTVNRWVTDGHWLSAEGTLNWLRALRFKDQPEHAHSCAWLTGFVTLYEPLIAQLLLRRDRWLAHAPDPEQALKDERREVISCVNIDWARDLQRLEKAIAGLDAATPSA